MTRGRRLVGRRRLLQRRRRRAPEEARLEILDAADRVFAESQPDQVGLKEVAREAGVSHALITHYFGTYAGLIEAALERRVRALRETVIARLGDTSVIGRPAELIGLLMSALEDPAHLRLLRWMLASERPSAAHAFGLQAQGLSAISAQVAAALVPNVTREVLTKVELALLTAVAAAYGYALAKHALVGALGREPSPALDAEVRDTLAAMIQTHLRTQL